MGSRKYSKQLCFRSIIVLPESGRVTEELVNLNYFQCMLFA